MHWNEYSSRVEGVGDGTACDEAILLKCWQFALVACMSFVMIMLPQPAENIAIRCWSDEWERDNFRII